MEFLSMLFETVNVVRSVAVTTALDITSTVAQMQIEPVGR